MQIDGRGYIIVSVYSLPDRLQTGKRGGDV